LVLAGAAGGGATGLAAADTDAALTVGCAGMLGLDGPFLEAGLAAEATLLTFAGLGLAAVFLAAAAVFLVPALVAAFLTAADEPALLTAVGFFDTGALAFAAGLATALEVGFVGAAAFVLDTGLGAGFAATDFLAAGLTADRPAGLAVAFGCGLATAFFGAGLALDLAADEDPDLAALALGCGFAAFAALATGLDFLAGAFNTGLLAAAAWPLSEGALLAVRASVIPLFGRLSEIWSARDCSDLPSPQPIILKKMSITTPSEP
jgi:hypothetical protein